MTNNDKLQVEVRDAVQNLYLEDSELNKTRELIRRIIAKKSERQLDLMSRRFQKLAEEMGEANEAHLSVTSECNAKNKTWADVREELVDMLIIIIDMVTTPMPDQVGDTDTEILMKINKEIERKLNKWDEKEGKSTVFPPGYVTRKNFINEIIEKNNELRKKKKEGTLIK